MQHPEQGKLVVLTAFMAEAVPTINAFRLKKQKAGPGYHLFQSEAVDLIVAGMGAARMSRAIEAYLLACPSDSTSRWLNIGTAGALDVPLGERVWVDHLGGDKIGLPSGLSSARIMPLLSLDGPSTDYRPGCLFDMEAQACLTTLSEKIIEFEPANLFCAKVVSDNQARPELIKDKHRIMAIMQVHQKEFSQVIKTL